MFKVLQSMGNQLRIRKNLLPIEDQKRFFVETLDKNMLYVPYSEIDDEDYKISEADKKLNRILYEGK